VHQGTLRTRSNSSFRLIISISVLLLTVSYVAAQEVPVAAMKALPDTTLPAPVTEVTARDNPNDAGGTIRLDWQLSADDRPGGSVVGYVIYRALGADGEFTQLGDVPQGARTLEEGNAVTGTPYYYKVVPVTAAMSQNGVPADLVRSTMAVGPVESKAQWFDLRRINVAVGVVLLWFFILFMIYRAKSGKELFIRKLAGMEAVDEAVGRATEMGRKVLYVPGINDMDDVQTIAAMTILGHVAQLAAQYETWIEVPVCRSIVMVTAREVVKEAYTRAGRPDSFNENQVHYLTDDQFGYAAGIDGMVVREKPAAIFLLGSFFAESLILAETGNASGAIQIAGTAQPSQLPFFVAACDYTLIGEELFAASAYLSREPRLLGSLKGQDMGKAVILVAIVVGIVLETFGIWQFSRLFSVIE
jgi:hypothetical protein